MKHSKQTGAVFIELAIVLPLLIFLMLAAIDFSRAISEYKTIVNQAKSAARYLTTRAPGSATAQGICIVKTSTSDCSNDNILANLDSATITIQDASSSSSHAGQLTSQTSPSAVSINLITVTITNYEYNSIINGFNLGVFSIPASITFNPISVTMRQVN